MQGLAKVGYSHLVALGVCVGDDDFGWRVHVKVWETHGVN